MRIERERREMRGKGARGKREREREMDTCRERERERERSSPAISSLSVLSLCGEEVEETEIKASLVMNRPTIAPMSLARGSYR